MVRQAPCRHDRAAARDDAGHALRGERHVAQQHAGVDREVVDALLRLLDQRVAVDLPGQLLRLAVDLLQRLVDRHGADGHGRVADDPLAGRVDVLAGRQVHDGVGAPAGRPRHLLDLLLDGGGDGGVADVGVDLHQEVAADDHRLALGVVDVGRDDGRPRATSSRTNSGVDVLAQRDELHLRRDDAAAGVVHLGDVAAGLRAERLTSQAGELLGRGRVAVAVSVVGRRRRARPGDGSTSPRSTDPRLAQRRQAAADVGGDSGVGVRAARVVQAERAVREVRVRDGDVADGDAQVGTRALDVRLAARALGLVAVGVRRRHHYLPARVEKTRTPLCGSGEFGAFPSPALPGQVQTVGRSALSARHSGLPSLCLQL